MKIAFLSVFYPYRGGIAQFNAGLYRALESEHQVKAFNFSTQYPNFLFPGKTQLVEEKDNADKIPSARTLSSVNPFSYIKTAKAVKKFNPDILIIGYWMPFMAPSLGYVAGKLQKSCKVIAVVHNAIPHETKFYDKPFINYFLKKNDAYVALSKAVEEDLLQMKPDAKVLMSEHPIYNHFGELLNRDEQLNKLNINPSKKILLFFGLIREYKGLDTLLSALANLDDEYHLIIAGECYGSFEKYQDQIDENNLSQNITIISEYIADNEVNKYFSAADVCILPYKSATQSGITAVSHHFNLPLIATDVGGLKESVKHNVTGLIVKENTSESLQNSITAYFDQNLKSEFSYNISKEKKENSWEKFSQKLIDFSAKI